MRFVAALWVLAAACGGDHAAVSDASSEAAIDAEPDAAPAPDASTGCTADVECMSGACDEVTGACVDEARAIFAISFGGMDQGTCTRAQPCATVAYAAAQVTPTRNFIALGPGAYAGAVTLGMDATVSGPTKFAGGATLTEPTQTQPVVTTTANVTLEYLSVHGRNPSSISATAGDLTLRHVHVASAVIGVSVAGASVHVFDSDVFATNHGFGTSSPLEIARSRIHGGGYGIEAGAPATISNCVISDVSNAGVSSAVAGVKISFSTFTENQAYAVYLAVGDTVDSSILDGNVGANGATFTYSLFSIGAPPAGAGNLMGAPGFVTPFPNGDYHLTAGSPAVDHGNPAGPPATDLDGAARPQGAGPDIGAYELH